jgi:hypothetical protein
MIRCGTSEGSGAGTIEIEDTGALSAAPASACGIPASTLTSFWKMSHLIDLAGMDRTLLRIPRVDDVFRFR